MSSQTKISNIKPCKSIIKNTKITQKNTKDYYNFFDNYIKSFERTTDKDKLFKIKLKYKHSLRVVKIIKRISESIKLSEKDSLIAETIALFHDIGRFEQITKYNTFYDAISVDHADLGVKILKKYRVFEGLDPETKSIIYKSISYHNKIEIPKKEDKKVKFFSRLIRDADKIDIFHVLITEYRVMDKTHREDPDKVIEKRKKTTSLVTKKVLSDFLNHLPINRNDVNTDTDLILIRLGFLYDINFYKSFQIIKNRNYMDRFITLIPKKIPKKEQEKIRENVLSFLKRKLKELKGKDCNYYINL